MKTIALALYHFVKKHPYISYGIVGIPSCFLMCTGALAIRDGFYEEDMKEEK